MRKTTRNLQIQQKRQAEQSTRLVYGDVTDDSPLTVSLDNGATSQTAVALDGLTLAVNDRVAILKSGNSPGLVIGVLT